jgi:hypothetical protein
MRGLALDELIDAGEPRLALIRQLANRWILKFAPFSWLTNS